MRINKFVAQATGLSRRAADTAIAEGRVLINGARPDVGTQVSESDSVTLNGQPLTSPTNTTTIMFNKPPGFVVSRDGQGSRTIYDILPERYHALKPVGRLDKDSSGLLLLTNDGELANQLTHPRYVKTKIYEVTLRTALQPLHRQMIHEYGVNLEDGNSQLQLERLIDGDDTRWRVTMHEGRNRQIRRTFDALGYNVTGLHRVQFGHYALGELERGTCTLVM